MTEPPNKCTSCGKPTWQVGDCLGCQVKGLRTKLAEVNKYAHNHHHARASVGSDGCIHLIYSSIESPTPIRFEEENEESKRSPEVDRLASFLMEHYPYQVGDGTKGAGESAVDMAIRLLRPPDEVETAYPNECDHEDTEERCSNCGLVVTVKHIEPEGPEGESKPMVERLAEVAHDSYYNREDGKNPMTPAVKEAWEKTIRAILESLRADRGTDIRPGDHVLYWDHDKVEHEALVIRITTLSDGEYPILNLMFVDKETVEPDGYGSINRKSVKHESVVGVHRDCWT